MNNAHPFTFEPGAQALFMGVSEELRRLQERIIDLEKRIRYLEYYKLEKKESEGESL